jgi:hypothetical protein
MHVLRPWHVYRHRHPAHDTALGRQADGFAHLLMSRVDARLALNEAQRRHLGAWLQALQRQRDALTRLARGPRLAALADGEGSARDGAGRPFDDGVDALRDAGPGLVAAFADFFDSLDEGQRRGLRAMLAGHNAAGHAPTAAD